MGFRGGRRRRSDSGFSKARVIAPAQSVRQLSLLTLSQAFVDGCSPDDDHEERRQYLRHAQDDVRYDRPWFVSGQA